MERFLLVALVAALLLVVASARPVVVSSTVVQRSFRLNQNEFTVCLNVFPLLNIIKIHIEKKIEYPLQLNGAPLSSSLLPPLLSITSSIAPGVRCEDDIQ